MSRVTLVKKNVTQICTYEKVHTVEGHCLNFND